MKDLQLGRAFRLLWQTLPFLALRAAVYFGCAIFVLASLVGCTAAGFAIEPEVGGLVGFAVGLTISGAVGYWLREYVLYMVKAGHIAVLVELVDGRPLPEGQSQLAYAKQRVAETFVQASVFFAVDQAIKGVLGAISRLFQGVLAFIPGLDGLSGFVDRLLKVSLGFVDEVILALSYRTRSSNPWRTSKQGLILYAQNYKRIVKSAFFLCFVYYGLLVPFFFIALMSCAAVVTLLPNGAWFLALVAALLFSWSLKKAFLEPLMMTAVMQLYFRCIEGQVPNPEWEAKLDKLSGKFRGLADKARSFGGDKDQDELPGAVPVAAQAQLPAQHGQVQPAQPPYPQQPHAQEPHGRPQHPHQAHAHPEYAQQPQHVQPQYAQPQQAQPQQPYAQPQQAQPQQPYAQPQYAQPQYAQPQYAQPQHAQPQHPQPQHAQQHYAQHHGQHPDPQYARTQPSYAHQSPQYGSPSAPTPHQPPPPQPPHPAAKPVSPSVGATTVFAAVPPAPRKPGWPTSN